MLFCENKITTKGVISLVMHCISKGEQLPIGFVSNQNKKYQNVVSDLFVHFLENLLFHNDRHFPLTLCIHIKILSKSKHIIWQ